MSKERFLHLSKKAAEETQEKNNLLNIFVASYGFKEEKRRVDMVRLEVKVNV